MLLRHPVERSTGLEQEERERMKSESHWYIDNTNGVVWGRECRLKELFERGGET